MMKCKSNYFFSDMNINTSGSYCWFLRHIHDG